jgi:hypothetical protein
MPSYLQPTYSGLRYAVASAQPDSLRSLMHGLIQNRNTTTADLERFVDHQNFTDRKAVGVALFKLQGEGLINSTEEPDNTSEGPLDDALTEALGQVSSDGKGILAGHDGMVIAYSGTTATIAKELAAVGTSMLPMGDRISDDGFDEVTHPWEITVNNNGAKVTFMRLNIGSRTFLLASGEIDSEAIGFQNLASLLIQRYLTSL